MPSIAKTKRYYGWGFYRTPEDPTQCIKAIWVKSGYEGATQCSRKRGHGPDGLYCKHHSRGLPPIAPC